MPPHRIVIAGGGVAALEAALAVGTLGGERVDATLLSPVSEFAYPAHQVVEPFGAQPGLRLALAEILAGTGVSLRHDALEGVDPARRMIETSSRALLPYDGLLVAVGAIPRPAHAHGITFDHLRDPGPFAELVDDIEQGFVGEVALTAPGATGWSLPAFDLALVLRAWSARRGIQVAVRVVSAERTPLEAFGEKASAAVAAVLDHAGVEFVGGHEPEVLSDAALLAGSRWVRADRIVSLPRLAGPRVPGLPCDRDGFLLAGRDGAVPGCPGVRAAGDGAASPIKQGGLAAQQGDRAARAMLAEAGARVAPAEAPVLRGVLATPAGPLFLEAVREGPGRRSVASFTPLWSPPSKVATRWLAPHLDGLVSRRTAAFAA
jgi:sulfide:quinone oxidoreductase